MAIYSRNLVRAEAGVGMTALAMVPTGELWIVKDVRIAYYGAIIYAQLGIYDGVYWSTIMQTYPGEEFGFYKETEAFISIEEGLAINLYTDGSAASVEINGYKFILP